MLEKRIITFLVLIFILAAGISFRGQEQQDYYGLESLSPCDTSFNIPPPPDNWPHVCLDWRNNGGNYVTEVRIQKCGSCWAFASVGALESQVLIKLNNPNLGIDLSEQYLLTPGDAANLCYCNLLTMDDYPGGCKGGNICDAAKYLKYCGTVDQLCLDNKVVDTCQEDLLCSDSGDRLFKLQNWVGIDYSDPQYQRDKPTILKAAIYQYGPVVVGFKHSSKILRA